MFEKYADIRRSQMFEKYADIRRSQMFEKYADIRWSQMFEKYADIRRSIIIVQENTLFGEVKSIKNSKKQVYIASLLVKKN